VKMSIFEFFNQASAQRAMRIILWLGVAYLAARLIAYHWLIISNPYPAEYREGAMLMTTDLLLKGGNPFALANQPQYTNVYGILYHWLILPFAKVFGPTLFVHRMAAGMFIGAACLSLFMVMRFMGIEVLSSIIGVLFFYSHLIFPSTTTPLAGPHSLGVFLFILSIYIPLIFRFSYVSLAMSVILALLGFYAKIYYFLGAPYLTLYLFLFVSKKKSLLYGITSLAGLIISIVIMNHYSDCYFNNTVFNNVTNAGNFLNHCHKQFIAYFQYYQGFYYVVAASVVYLLVSLRAKRGNGVGIISFDFLNLHKPLLSFNFDLSLFCLICSTAIIYFKMGQHGGSWLAYLFQLISPFLIVVVFNLLKKLKAYTIIALLFLVMTLSVVVRLHFPLKFEDGGSEWQKIEALISVHQNIFNTPAIVPLLIEQNKNVVDSGSSEYFGAGTIRRTGFGINFKPDIRIAEKYYEYFNKINDDIHNKRYDLMIITRNWAPLVSGDIVHSYDYVAAVPVAMPFTRQNWELTIWKPKP